MSLWWGSIPRKIMLFERLSASLCSRSSSSSRTAERSGSSTPMGRTKTFGEAPVSVSPAFLKPLRDMKRTKQARKAFKDSSAFLVAAGRGAEKLQSVMSPEWAVKLQGTRETSLATSAMEAVVAAQCAWIWSALHSRAKRASHKPLGYTARLFRITLALRPLNNQLKALNVL